MKIIKFSSMSFQPASHEDPNDPGVLKKILLKKEDLLPGDIQMINWAYLPIDKAFQSHYHESMDEVFIIVSGKAKIKIGDDEAELERGDAVIIPEGKTHVMTNTCTEPVEYIALGVSHGNNGKTVNI